MEIGQRTLFQVIEELSSVSGDQIWVQYFETSQALSAGKARVVTFADLARAIDTLSWWIKDNLGLGHDSEVLCYIGRSDIAYFILAFAAYRCGWKALFSSPKNGLDAHVHLINATNCTYLLTSGGVHQNTADAISSAHGDLKTKCLPQLEAILHAAASAPFPRRTCSYDDDAEKTFVILHTSGSTGLPKPVPITNGCICTIDAQQLLRDVEGRQVTAHAWAGKRVYSALPPFHSASFNFLAYSIFLRTQLIIGPSDTLPSAQLVHRILDLRIAEAGVLLPILLDEMASDPEILPCLSSWNSVAYGGAVLPQSIGDALWKVTKVVKLLGSTETFNLPELIPLERDEWRWNRFHPDLGIEFEACGDGLHELFFQRNERLRRHQGAFWTFPEAQRYSMGDIYQQHPRDPSLWLHRGRKDDIIVFSNGEKFRPKDAELMIAEHAEVGAALLVGSGRAQAALIIEAAKNSALLDMANHEKIAALAGVIAAANSVSPSHAQIDMQYIRVIPSGSFSRSAKGEIQRKKTLEELAKIIDEIYYKGEHSYSESIDLDFSNVDSLQDSLRKLVQIEILRSGTIDVDDQMFQLGIDSLQATRLAKIIRSSAKAQQRGRASKITTRMNYEFPTIHSLARAVMRMIDSDDSEMPGQNKIRTMQTALNDYRQRLGTFTQASPARIVDKDHTVILTGSTGSLGSYLLDRLLQDPIVKCVVCLNRKGGSASRQISINRSRGLSTDMTKAEFLEVDTAVENLGLSPEVYTDLQRRATRIIHNAWIVNFNMPLSTFMPQIEGCLQLIKFSCEAPNAIPINFLSSVGAANKWSLEHDGPVPETLIDDLAVSEDMGYAESKQIAELLFARASETHHVPATICRLGQIAGPVNTPEHGMWNPQEWLPSLMLTSQTMGMVPQTLGVMDRIDWLPVDLLASTIVEIVLQKEDAGKSSLLDHVMQPIWRLLGIIAPADSRTSTSASFINLVNHRQSRWSELLPQVIAAWQPKIQTKPYTEWLHALNEISGGPGTQEKDKEDSLSQLPAAKLTGFFADIDDSVEHAQRRRVQFTTNEALKMSRTFRDMKAVSAEWIILWLRQLHYIT